MHLYCFHFLFSFCHIFVLYCCQVASLCIDLKLFCVFINLLLEPSIEFWILNAREVSNNRWIDSLPFHNNQLRLEVTHLHSKLLFKSVRHDSTDSHRESLLFSSNNLASKRHHLEESFALNHSQ
jgi:hypothetical protein